MTKVFCEIMFTSFVRLEWMITSQAIGSTNTEWFTWKAEISLQLFPFVVAFACINHRAMWLFIIAHVWLDYCEIFFFVLNLFFLIYISLIKKDMRIILICDFIHLIFRIHIIIPLINHSLHAEMRHRFFL